MTGDAEQDDRPLLGRTVLLVEDNYLNAIALRSALEEMGCRVLGPIATLQEGLAAAAKFCFDLAVLDINILGGTSMPIAETLLADGRPFIFVTGYGSPRNLPPMLHEVIRLSKPVKNSTLQTNLLRALGAS